MSYIARTQWQIECGHNQPRPVPTCVGKPEQNITANVEDKAIES